MSGRDLDEMPRSVQRLVKLAEEAGWRWGAETVGLWTALQARRGGERIEAYWRDGKFQSARYTVMVSDVETITGPAYRRDGVFWEWKRIGARGIPGVLGAEPTTTRTAE